MPREFSRPQRVADFLQRELASLIQFELRDPRIGMVSVNEVQVSRDLAHAKVYVTVMGKDTAEEAADSLEALNRASGFLRTQIARSAQMRTTPRIHFYFDASVRRGAQLSALIDQAVDADRRLHDHPADEE